MIPDSSDRRVLPPAGPLRGRIKVPGDKSISHRALMFSAIARGTSRLTGFLEGADCLATASCLRAMGVTITTAGPEVVVEGRGLRGLLEPDDVLDVGNSGTTIRMLTGLLAGSQGLFVLTGDASIRRRPMARILVPLREMGAVVLGRDRGRLAPVVVQGSPLRGLHYTSPVASAQLKSAVLLAGLFAEGETSVSEPVVSRDHTERMLSAMGVAVARDGTRVSLVGGGELAARDVAIPGDLSSAAFWLVAATLVPESDLVIENVGLNPTRDGLIEALERMGADIQRLDPRVEAGEPVADLRVRAAPLRGIDLDGELVVRMIDEIPIFALAAASARGETRLSGAGELRVKESDRLAAIARSLGALGATIQETPDGLVISGGTRWRDGSVDSQGDHRIAMMGAIASWLVPTGVAVSGVVCVETSYPAFFETVDRLRS